VGDLHVTVAFHGRVIEDRTVPVRGAVRLGDEINSLLQFPGASIVVYRVGDCLDVRGRRLAEGQSTGFSLGAVQVEVEHTEPTRLRMPSSSPIDPRFLLVALAVSVGGLWVDTLSSLQDAPRVVQVSRALGLQADPRGEDADPRQERTAAVQPGGLTLAPDAVAPGGDARAAAPDDDVTGWGYFGWYRQAVPGTIDAELARLKLLSQPDDPALRHQVARGEYNNDNFEEAARLYAELLVTRPDDVRALEGLAGCMRRLGRHRAEIELWDRALRYSPQSVMALGGRAVALARLGEYARASAQLDHLGQLSPDHALVPLYGAMVHALIGDQDEALALVEDAVAARGSLPEALQVELRRDLALDPAFAPLRAELGLRRVLYRHFGAAAPRSLR
jgi:tetratricopeptide (TPR) repeat protein